MEEKKIGRKLDHLIMGVILGGAIGSVLGLTLAPKKGKETRELLKKKGQELAEKGKEVSQKLIRDHRETIEGAKYQMRKGKGFLRWLLRKSRSEEPMPKVHIEESDE